MYAESCSPAATRSQSLALKVGKDQFLQPSWRLLSRLRSGRFGTSCASFRLDLIVVGMCADLGRAKDRNCFRGPIVLSNRSPLASAVAQPPAALHQQNAVRACHTPSCSSEPICLRVRVINTCLDRSKTLPPCRRACMRTRTCRRIQSGDRSIAFRGSRRSTTSVT